MHASSFYLLNILSDGTIFSTINTTGHGTHTLYRSIYRSSVRKYRKIHVAYGWLAFQSMVVWVAISQEENI